jgi:2',3'-cyclic-nucleotide 2'-phosphodiesterase (5'-nucleotidase family)
VEEVPVLDAWEVARRWVPTLRAQANLVVVLSHLGLRRDVQLAQEVPGIDLILGGHSHHRLPSLLHIGDTAIAQAGVNGEYLGVVTASVGEGRPVFTGRLEPVWQDIAEDEDAAEAVAQFLSKEWQEGAEVVATTGGCWADPWLGNPWCDFVTDTLRRAAGADICFYNANALLPALSPGPVRRWDLQRCLPGKQADETINLGGLKRLVLTGEDIRGVCEHSVSDLPRDVGPQVPAGFCLPGNPFLHVSGIRVVYDLTRPKGERVRHLAIDDQDSREGQAVEPSRLYRIVTSDFLSRGYSGYHWFRDATERHEEGPEIPLLLEGLQQTGLPPAVPAEREERLEFRNQV